MSLSESRQSDPRLLECLYTRLLLCSFYQEVNPLLLTTIMHIRHQVMTNSIQA